MKRAQLCILVLVICLSLCACGGDAQEGTSSTNSTAPYFTPELTFEPSNDLTSYVVTGLSGIPQSMDIVIPATYQGHPVTEIADEAFCEVGLTSISIPDSVTKIGGLAFYKCKNLKALYISDLAHWCSIDFGGFYANPLYLGARLYVDGTEMTDLTFPDGVTTISDWAFCGYRWAWNITIGNGVTHIGGAAFRESSVREVTIGDSVTEIDTAAFMYCESLRSITIGKNVTYVAEAAFHGCTFLETVTITSSRTELCAPPFDGCEYLTDVYYNGTTYDYKNNGFYVPDTCVIHCTDGDIIK